MCNVDNFLNPGLIRVLEDESSAAAADSIQTAPNLFVVAGIALLLLLLIAGFLIWKFIFSSREKTDFSSQYREVETKSSSGIVNPNAKKSKNQFELHTGTVSSSADTVSNKTDDDVVDELTSPFSSQATVDAMGDASVSTDDEDE